MVGCKHDADTRRDDVERAVGDSIKSLAIADLIINLEAEFACTCLGLLKQPRCEIDPCDLLRQLEQRARTEHRSRKRDRAIFRPVAVASARA